MNVSDDLLKAIGVTLELTSTTLSKDAIRVIANDLAAYPEPQVLASLKRCCRELKGRLTLADILARIDDGRPDPEGAWASIPKDESGSVVWTTEMRDAWAVAYPLIAEGDLVPARMAFLERYRVAVQQARDARRPVEWEFSPGTDKDGRELVLLDAATKGRISVEGARALLPHHRADEGLNARLLALAGKVVPVLAAPGDAGKEARAALRQKFKPLPKAAA